MCYMQFVYKAWERAREKEIVGCVIIIDNSHVLGGAFIPERAFTYRDSDAFYNGRAAKLLRQDTSARTGPASIGTLHMRNDWRYTCRVPLRGVT